MACSSPCYYVVDLDLPVIDIECTETDPDGKKITVSKSLPLFHGTVLKKEEKDKYVFVQTLYADGHTIKLESVVIEKHIAPLALQPVDIVKHKDTIRAAEDLINLIYSLPSGPDFEKYSKTLEEYVEKWVEKPPIKNTACCVIAGGRRRPKKSRRSRSSRKRRQTRSK